MSALYGAVARRGQPIDERALARMASRLRHRGPDGQHELRRPGLTFGHCLLQTDDQGPPPPQSRGDLLVTCDTRLDDRDALIDRLGLDSAEDPTDAHLILAAWRRWQTACPEHLHGDFAFCLWDASRRRLFCARDRLGVRPLCYRVTPEAFLFASEASAIDAFLAGGPIDRLRMAEYLLGLEDVDFTRTFFDGVHRLPPGHHLVLEGEAVTLTRYWSPRALELPSRDPAELVELGRDLLDRSVRRRRARGSTTACLLSGGLDSATVLEVLRHQTDDLLACSAISTEPECADTRAVRCLTVGTPSLQIALEDTEAWLADVLPIQPRLDDPFASVMTLAAALYRAAAARGIRVVLDGMEGDLVYSLFAGYPRALLREGRPGAALSELWHLSAQRYAPPFPRALATFVAGTLMPESLRRRRRRIRNEQALQDALAESPLSAELREDPAVLAHLRRHEEEPAPLGTFDLHRQWLQQPVLVTALERYDRMAAVCGVEARHPLLDVDLVEYALNLPWHLKRWHATPKRILRLAMQGRLPDAIVAREDKPHLGWAFNERLMMDQWPSMQRAMSDSAPLLSEWVDTGRAIGCCAGSSYDPEEPSAEPWDLNALRQWLVGLDHRTRSP